MSGDRDTWAWSCSKCKGDASGDWAREARNCDGKTSTVAFDWHEDLDVCPWSVIDDESWLLLEVYIEWKTFRVLPDAGDLFDQPAYIFDAIALCESIRIGMESERIEMMRKQQEAEARKRRDG